MMQYKVEKVFQTVMYTIKITMVSFLGNRNHNIIFLSWQLVCAHFTSNAEIFKMVVDRYNKYLLQVFCSSCLHISFLDEN